MFQFPALAHAFRHVGGLQPPGLPHSDICGSKPVCSSPQLFAAYHVLLRRLKPKGILRSLFFASLFLVLLVSQLRTLISNLSESFQAPFQRPP